MTVHDDDREELERPALDGLLDALRQPARPDELAGEHEAVTAMVAALAAARTAGPVPVTGGHRRKLAAVGVAAALILGGVTAAAASVLSSSSGDKVQVPTQPSTSTLDPTTTGVPTSTSSTTAP